MALGKDAVQELADLGLGIRSAPFHHAEAVDGIVVLKRGLKILHAGPAAVVKLNIAED